MRDPDCGRSVMGVRNVLYEKKKMFCCCPQSKGVGACLKCWFLSNGDPIRSWPRRKVVCSHGVVEFLGALESLLNGGSYT
jgi:hypothetical protein